MSRRTACSQYLTGAAILVTLLTIVALCLPDVANVRELVPLMDAQNRLRQVMFALQEYEDACEKLPNAAIVDEKGRPLHSWRTAILPFLDSGSLYRRIDLTRAWNESVNAELVGIRIEDLESPRATGSGKAGLTNIVAVVGTDTVIRNQGEVTIDEIPDGASATGVLIEFIESDIGWAEPRDVSVEEAIRIIQTFDGFRGVAVVLADGSFETVPPNATAENIRKLFNCSDGPPSDDIYRIHRNWPDK